MPINPDAVGTSQRARSSHSWTSKDALLYALGVGAGPRRPCVHHREHQRLPQQVLPTMAVVLGVGGCGAMARSARSTRRCSCTVSRRSSCTARSRRGRGRPSGEITGIYDKGKGAVVEITRRPPTLATSEPLFTADVGVHPRRGRVGWRARPVGAAQRRRPSAPPTTRSPTDDPTRPGAALPALGRPQPAALRPVVRAMGGFDRPILHGLCTYGFTGRALLHALCGSDPARFVDGGRSRHRSSPARR